MANKYNVLSDAGSSRFSRAPLSELEFSKLKTSPFTFTTFNAGDIVPLRVIEVLPHQSLSIDMDFVMRLQSAVVKPTMTTMQVDLFAYYVANEAVNTSWKNVQGENTSGFWSAPEVSLAPLVPTGRTGTLQIPVGSVADYYGLPTQAPIPNQVLSQMNDTIFRGYLSIYNSWFRDENYSAPLSFSKLNVYNGFLEQVGESINASTKSVNATNIDISTPADGSFPGGSVREAIHGQGSTANGGTVIGPRLTNFSALDAPLKANKLHDFVTSGLPSPQKGPDVVFGIGDIAPLNSSETDFYEFDNQLKVSLSNGQGTVVGDKTLLSLSPTGDNFVLNATKVDDLGSTSSKGVVTASNVYADLSTATGVSVNDLRMALAVQHIYEALARSGSRYTEILANIFGLEHTDLWRDRPIEIGHIRRELDLFQVAQTSASLENETPQGNLSAFGYTNSNGNNFFTFTAPAHGYIHILAVVRQKNIYSTFVHPTWFRRNTLDWYWPQLANISEQPMRLVTLNPFNTVDNNMERVIAYQEAWWDYRHDVNMVTGQIRSGLNNGLDIWLNADDFDPTFTHVNGEWLKSNAQEVLDKTLAVNSMQAHQFVCAFRFKNIKNLPMPTYGIPGEDVV